MSSTLPGIIISRSTTAPPGSPNTVDKYIVPSGATGAWAENTNKITWYEHNAWFFITPPVGFTVPIQDENNEVYWTGSTWALVVNGTFASITLTSVAGIKIPSGTPGIEAMTLYQVGGYLYFNGNRVGLALTSMLAGFTLGTDGTSLSSQDNILQGFQKLQVQINNKTGGVGITRQTIVITTDILASSAKKIGIVSLAKSAMIVSVGTDYPAWVRIYNDAVSLVADNTRQITTWPTAGTGIVLDVVTTVAIPVIKQSPGELFANNNTPTDSSCYILITNLDSVARAITLTIVYLPLEV